MPNPQTGLQKNEPTPADPAGSHPNPNTETKTELEKAAHQLARQHQQTVTTKDFPPFLIQRLAAQTKSLADAHQYFLQSTRDGQYYSAAAEWMLDNYYIVKQAIRQINQDLPLAYYQELPKLTDPSEYASWPRIYALARDYTLGERCYTDITRLKKFVLAYQQATSLKMGEVWALPIMLRFCLLECLAQATTRVTQSGANFDDLDQPFHFAIEAADNEIVANCILGLRQLNSTDWPAFFEQVSQVEQILRQDPVNLYGRMTFKTRDRYRKIVEELAEAAHQTETHVAETAVQLAQAHSDPPINSDPWAGLAQTPAGHVGTYLLGPARRDLEQKIGYRPQPLRRWLSRHTTFVYLGSIFLLSLLLLVGLVAVGQALEAAWWQHLLLLVVGIVPVTAVAIGVINWLVTSSTTPNLLPKLDFSDGVPASCRTMVVIPALLSEAADVDRLFSQLEQHYLRNPDPHLSFALLTDFADAPEAEMPEDQKLVEKATAVWQALNQKYPQHPFYLFHRRRLHNPSEGEWMGWERKRGKLHEFNQLLRGAQNTSFTVQLGKLTVLPEITYVITLDADTILPVDTANRLIGAIAHPLNQAHCEAHSGRVTAGYTVLQPRTEVLPTSAGQSLFTRVFTGDAGLDLYSVAVSDVYQDLFGEGIYMGKGIYDVDAFACSLANRVPENSLLSHDLFEGVQGRAGLVTDIVLYEDYPPHYLLHVGRAHRWIRGDWQLLPWLFPLVPSADGRIRNDLPILARWKIFDNLRRSLVVPTRLLFFIAAWLWLPGSPFIWTVIGLLLTAVPLVTAVFTAVERRLGQSASWYDAQHPIQDSAIRWLLHLTLLPYETLLHLDAIAVTLWRRFVSRRHLLQWTDSARTVKLLGEISAEKMVGHMVRSLLLVGVLLILLAFWRSEALPVALPFLLLWALSSEILHWFSRPRLEETADLTPTEKQRLRSLARRTWLFFEEYVGPEDNWLPPDHYQESPRGVVAHRTSPTNIGLYLLSALGAYDLGYISLLNLSLRLNDTFDTLDRLDKYRGHLLNWLDTQTLHHLNPRYVSTVDSGNLAGCLLALKQGCLAIHQQPVWRDQRWLGLLDTLALFNEAIAILPLNERVTAVQQQIAVIEKSIAENRAGPLQWATLLEQLSEERLPELNRRLLALFEEDSLDFRAETVNQWRLIMEHLHGNVTGMERELKLLCPWLLAFANPPTYFTAPDVPEEVTTAWQAVRAALPLLPKLGELLPACRQAEHALAQLQDALPPADAASEVAAAKKWCANLQNSLVSVRLTAEPLLTSYQMLAERADRLVAAMDFTFLYNKQRHVFHIGYNLESSRLDNNFYDLLASEARIASLVAIAKRDVPQKHWLHLARPLTQLHDGRALLSWSGTMFEYLMPPLLMHNYPDTLLTQSCLAVIDHQIAYGAEHDIPWGISESGFYTFDNARNYQYRAFGVPGTGLKRGLSDDLVVAPYASVLALKMRPRAVSANLDHLLRYQMMGQCGLYEAIDFTPSRLQLGQEAAVIQSYMSHHQGMVLLSLVNYLHDNLMPDRFHAEPAIKSVELLLQEQLPHTAPLQAPHAEAATGDARLDSTNIVADPWTVPRETPLPLVHYLSNGRLATLITNSGSGYLTLPDRALTRWRPDTTLDDWGVWLYLQDRDSGEFWSAGPQPVPQSAAQNQEIQFYPHKAYFRRHDHDITLELEISIAPEEDVEIRYVQLTNDSDQTRRLRLTSYGEVVLTDAATDRRHQAFAKLFVESEYVSEHNLLVFRRRPRSDNESPHYLGHMLVAPADLPLTRAYDSDRAQFLGRSRSASSPAALQRPDRWLTKTTGATLDPIMALGQEVDLPPHTAVELAWLTFTADTRPALLKLAEEYRRWTVIRRAFADARAQAEQELHRQNLPVSDLAQVQRLLSLLLYPHAARRPGAEILSANSQGQSGLWAYGISGDYPILLLNMSDETDSKLLTLLLRAHTYWRRRGLQIDLVIMNQQETNYGQLVQSTIFRAVHRMDSENWLNKRGGIFILRVDQMSEADAILLETAARVVLHSAAGSLATQLAQLGQRPPALPPLNPTAVPADITGELPPLGRPDDLQFDNGWGGFTPDGQEYLIHLEPGQATPAPWINVVANEEFGFLVSETGGGYTWAKNSGENRLTSWRNDPVSDTPAEVLYLRDEETGEIWTPTPQPAPADAPYQVQHGAGYTTFTHHSHQLKQRLRLFAAPDAPVKIIQLRLENGSDRARRLTATYFAEWVLGPDRAVMQPFIIPSYRASQRALLARNPYNAEFGEAVAFLATSKEPHGFSADRAEFLGRMGSLQAPEALKRIGLSDSTRVGADPAAIMQLHIDLPPGGSEEITFLLGQGADEAEALATLARFGDEDNVTAAWDAVHALWDEILGTIQVQTPDVAMNVLLNRWLLYQALACRIWGRSALYQSSGAYGFRDQLQDVMSLLHARPDLAREHLLRSARHQFEAGDVLHWWHPPSGRGVRTQITDDLVWLPYVTAVYIQSTGDTAVLDATAPFLLGEPLKEDEEDRYGHFEQTRAEYTLYEHCCRVLKRAATEGRHGLPLMGAGDWNDGMNRVGIHGEGESVWLGWFIAAALQKFADLCQQRGDESLAAEFREQADAYRTAIETEAWDGNWYRRAYYDDGTPLGSQENDECRIDAIAQSWAVLTGLGRPVRLQQAMRAVDEQLIKEEDRLVLLFTPPFDETRHDPGYIKGYLPGIRENGGQYTHAALWTIWAFAELGQGAKAEALYRMINPIYRSDSREKAAVYKVEPYVISADVYGVSPHEGRGGWTWYTGSSGWMYRLGIEGILGVQRCGQKLVIRPQIPPAWPGFTVTYRYGRSQYQINVQNDQGSEEMQVWLDGEKLDGAEIPLVEDGRIHKVTIHM